MSHLVHKRYNVSILIYHIVCPAKYRQIVFSEEVDQVLKVVCLDIAKRYEMDFLEIGIDRDHGESLKARGRQTPKGEQDTEGNAGGRAGDDSRHTQSVS